MPDSSNIGYICLACLFSLPVWLMLTVLAGKPPTCYNRTPQCYPHIFSASAQHVPKFKTFQAAHAYNLAAFQCAAAQIDAPVSQHPSPFSRCLLCFPVYPPERHRSASDHSDQMYHCMRKPTLEAG